MLEKAWARCEGNGIIDFETKTMESDIQPFLPYFLIESTLSDLCETTLINSSTERKRMKPFLLWELKAPHDMKVRIQENIFSGMVKAWLYANSVSWAGAIQTGEGRELGRCKGLLQLYDLWVAQEASVLSFEKSWAKTWVRVPWNHCVSRSKAPCVCGTCGRSWSGKSVGIAGLSVAV